MKNYTYAWKVKQIGYDEEVDVSEYTSNQKEMKEFVEELSKIVWKARCGWRGVNYKVMKNVNGEINEYMVLYTSTGDNDGRWIPVSGNSKGCNLSVIGENLW
jgi:hypothetical protein